MIKSLLHDVCTSYLSRTSGFVLDLPVWSSLPYDKKDFFVLRINHRKLSLVHLILLKVLKKANPYFNINSFLNVLHINHINSKIIVTISNQNSINSIQATYEHIDLHLVMLWTCNLKFWRIAIATNIEELLGTHFFPLVNEFSFCFFQKCIDILIEKEYLERVDGQKDVYSYLA